MKFDIGVVFPLGFIVNGVLGDPLNFGPGSCTKSNSCYDCNKRNPKKNLKCVIGTNSCTEVKSCKQQDSVTIGNGSCRGEFACSEADYLEIGDDSCNGSRACQACDDIHVGNGSCNDYYACCYIKGVTIGNGSCSKQRACSQNKDVDIGNNSCNAAKDVCRKCTRNKIIPDNVCNIPPFRGGTVSADGTYYSGEQVRCTYCHGSYSTSRAAAPVKDSAIAPTKDLTLSKMNMGSFSSSFSTVAVSFLVFIALLIFGVTVSKYTRKRHENYEEILNKEQHMSI